MDGRDWWPPNKWPHWPFPPKPPEPPPTNPKPVSKCCACIAGSTTIDKTQAEWVDVGTKPGDRYWVDIINALTKGCPELNPVTTALDRTRKAVLGLEEIYLSTGVAFNVYVRVQFRCCTRQGTWGPSRTIGPEQVVDGAGDGDYSTGSEREHLTDLPGDAATIIGNLIAAANYACQQSVKSTTTSAGQ